MGIQKSFHPANSYPTKCNEMPGKNAWPWDMHDMWEHGLVIVLQFLHGLLLE
jgi:hypothetical protein